MKKFLKIFILFFSINTSLLVLPENAKAQSVNFQVFYDDLSPHGNWIESPEYGYVWSPRVSGFSPYSTGGYWVMTDYGWTWISDYSWGWAPFHYGRWYYDNFYGYVWVPGYEWGPGWVSWRRSDDYYGWAPLGPGVSINVAYSNGYNIPYNNWRFVSCNNFGRRDIHNYYVDRSKNVTIINNTTVINNTRVDNARRTTYNPGPDKVEVQKKIGKPINTVAIVDEKKPAQRMVKNQIQLYRPVVQNNSNDERKPVPAKVNPAKDAKQNNVKQNEAINERRAKQDPAQADIIKPSEKRQPMKRDNDQPVTQQQQPAKKAIRDDQQTNKQPIQQPGKIGDIVPERQLPAQQPVRKEREEQSSQAERRQRTVPQQNVDRTPQRQEPVKQAPVQQPREERTVPQQNVDRTPERQQPVRQAPVQQSVRQGPVRQQPVRQAPPVRQEPMRQAPVQRQQPSMPRERKG